MENNNQCLPSTFELQVNVRVGELISLIGGAAEAGKLIGKTETTIKNYLQNANIPFVVAHTLCVLTGKSLNWLATGQDLEADQANADKVDNYKFLLDAMQTIDEWQIELGKTFEHPAQKRDAAIALCKFALEDQLESNCDEIDFGRYTTFITKMLDHKD